jgi:CHASE2 domain-containing sensor protein
MTSSPTDAQHQEPEGPGSTTFMTRLRQGVIWSVVTTCLIFFFQLVLHWSLEAPDEFANDWRVALFSPAEERKDIALVLIDDNSVAKYLSRSPVDRGLIAELVKAIDAAEPKGIGLDFVFDRKAEKWKADALVKAIKDAKSPVILGVTTQREGPIKSEILEEQDKFIASTGKPAGTLFFDGEEEARYTLGNYVVRKMGDRLMGKYNCTFDMLLAGLHGKKKMPANRII